MKVVNNVLESAELGQDSSMLRVHSIQTQSIHPAFLPQHASQSFAKKGDLALAFSSEHPTVATAIEPMHKANPDMALSQMTLYEYSTAGLLSGGQGTGRGLQRGNYTAGNLVCRRIRAAAWVVDTWSK